MFNLYRLLDTQAAEHHSCCQEFNVEEAGPGPGLPARLGIDTTTRATHGMIHASPYVYSMLENGGSLCSQKVRIIGKLAAVMVTVVNWRATARNCRQIQSNYNKAAYCAVVS